MGRPGNNGAVQTVSTEAAPEQSHASEHQAPTFPPEIRSGKTVVTGP